MNPNTAITEADLHALIDGQLSPERQREVEAYLAQRPDEARRLAAYREQKSELRRLFDPVLDETPPARLVDVARPRAPWYRHRLVAGIALALISAAAGWELRGGVERPPQDSIARLDANSVTLAGASGFAQRAAVAHTVYSPDQRRPVEVDAAHEDQLVAWLSKRMGAPMKPPRLTSLGYALEGGRLLPGGSGPVAQFMYRDTSGARLTVYVSNEGAVGKGEAATHTGFRFIQQGSVNVFYWIDGAFGYAISASADKAELSRISSEIYGQLNADRR
jgi:anti-sigma factor RsiW